ncbi:2-oxoglutarate dehydrogenase, E2 component, dihydrolipoamide succinyltransferase [Schumannella soli]|uniref:Dihydrolipoamide acetyltransferase component of pyruvate dehydrogenase complex n=1 Tax=Schumannella soli TaxID=2590779 RepID=A0A506XTL4_9MICO|nr:2-oxoglutarate dehydrogenase, E2 component, dihydrolipoamide succinyltransferase [Schumannella soli]TPW76164.1 2-oxoglutarate dehydrogenase, E2 component, dihydrolipoamide succinyltransferase [Schumannella soli]
MSESVSLPALGESVTEGTVTRWLKQVGDRVEVDEPLLEVSTDKVDTEIPSPVAGVIEEILVAEDETVEVGTDLVRIGDGSGGGDAAPAEQPAAEAPAAAPAAEAPAAAPAAEQPAPIEQAPAESAPAEQAPAPAEQPVPVAEQPVPAAPSTEQPAGAEATAPAAEPQAAPAAPAEQPAAAQPAAEPVAAAPAAEAPAAAPVAQGAAVAAQDGSRAGYVTPIVRKLANEKGIDLDGLSGTGVGGRIRKQDVLDAADAVTVPAAEAPSAAPAPAAAPVVEVSPLRGTTVPMSRLRKVVAQRAVVSLQSTAQLTTVVEVDVTKVAQLRDKVKAEFLEKTGTKLSFLPFFTLAAAEALKAFPVINATVDGESIVYPDHENISIAVDTERGLLTPVVRDAGEKNLAQLSQDIADLAGRTRDNKLLPDEMSGGTFTVTNTGSRGALFDTPLVFLPQVAILGTGIVVKKPVVVSQDGSDAIAIRSTVYLALSYDHRIVDGADAARFLTTVKARLEGGDFAGSLGI